jgi:hypothetical protein
VEFRAEKVSSSFFPEKLDVLVKPEKVKEIHEHTIIVAHMNLIRFV